MSLAMHEAQSSCIIILLENGAEPKFGNFRGIQTLNKRWKEIYTAAGFRLPQNSSAPDWDTCIPSLTILCKFFVRTHLQEMQPQKNLFHSVSNLHHLSPKMRNFLLNDIDLSKELIGCKEDEEDGEFRLIYYADYDQQTFRFWTEDPEE